MTKLEAVQYVMSNLGYGQVSGLDTGGASTAGKVERTIDDTDRSVQSAGWGFNTAYDREIARDGSNKIPLVANTLWVDSAQGRKVIDRNGFLYDIENQTDVFGSAQKLNYAVLISWTSIPVVVRRYIAARATRRHFEMFENRDDRKLGFLLQQEQEAKAMAERIDRRGAEFNILDNADAARFRGGRFRGSPGFVW